MAGYFGSKGTHLILRGTSISRSMACALIRRFRQSSPILPGTPLGNITQVESTGNSSYNALWVSADKRLARGLQINASYTWSKSLDYNSLSTQGIVVQDSYNLHGDRGPSDFDARQRFVVSAIYELPFHGNWFFTGWQLATIVQAQSGNPVNIVTPNSTRHRRCEHASAGCNRTDRDYRQRRSLVRYLGVYACLALWQSWPQCSRPGRDSTTRIFRS